MSFEFEIDDSDRCRADLIGAVGKDLQALFAKRKKMDGLTQQQLSQTLEVDKSRINRCLTGHANLTLGTTADLARAMNGRVLIKIVAEEDAGRWAIHWSNPNQVSVPNKMLVDRAATNLSMSQQSVIATWK